MKNRVLKILERYRVLRAFFRAYEFLKLANPRVWSRNIRYWGKLAPDGMPIPPPRLIVLVAGHSDISSFLEGGKIAAQSILDTLARNELSIDDFGAILDFGCGCGRVTRCWHFLENLTIFGTDYNPQLGNWCKQHLTFAQFETNQISPPLTYGNDRFDFIYALFVFTHVLVSLQHKWVHELSRILKPGGYLLITTHGEHYLDMLTQSEKEDFRAGRIVVRYSKVAGTNLCSVFHPEKYARGELLHSFEVVDLIPEGAKGNPYQDIYFLRKPTS